MSRGFPSMTALLGLLADAGDQNLRQDRGDVARARAELAGVGRTKWPRRPPGPSERHPGEAGAGGLLSGGLGELVDRFKQSGQGDTAELWVGTGPNKPVTPSQLEQTIGPDVSDTLTKKTGLPREKSAGKTLARAS